MQIKLLLPASNENGDLLEEELSITMSAPKLEEIREENGPRSTRGTGKFKPYSYSSDFYIKIPEFITKTLQGKVISENKNGATYNFDYTKGIRVASIQWLVREWTVMIKDYIEETRIKKEKDAPRTKVIFFRMYTTDYTQIKEIKYEHRIGYINNFGWYDEKGSYQGKTNPHKYVLFNDANEEFFNKLDSSFGNLITFMNEFEKNITDSKIKELSEGGQILLPERL